MSTIERISLMAVDHWFIDAITKGFGIFNFSAVEFNVANCWTALCVHINGIGCTRHILLWYVIYIMYHMHFAILLMV